MNKREAKPQNLHPRVIAYAEYFEIEPQRFLRFLKDKERIPGLTERFRVLRQNEHQPIPLRVLKRNLMKKSPPILAQTHFPTHKTSRMFSASVIATVEKCHSRTIRRRAERGDWPREQHGNKFLFSPPRNLLHKCATLSGCEALLGFGTRR